MSLELTNLTKGPFTIYYADIDETYAFKLFYVLDTLEYQAKELFTLTEPFECTFYILSKGELLPQIIGVNPRIGERFRILYETNSMYFYMDRIRGASLPEIAASKLGNLIFNNLVGENQSSVRSWRSPSWLREGYALQLSYIIRPDSFSWLREAWIEVVEAHKKNELIPLSVLAKDINLIPNPSRRRLAMHQSYFMVRLLIATLQNEFFKKYSQEMRENSEILAWEVFAKEANMDYEKFFGMFLICVENNIEL